MHKDRVKGEVDKLLHLSLGGIGMIVLEEKRGEVRRLREELSWI
jgi:hypothetical protein